MPSSIFAKYSPESIFGESSPVAIADNKLKIIWYNRNFKENFAEVRLKGKSISALLTAAGSETDPTTFHKKPTVSFLPKLKKEIRITPLFTENNKINPHNYKLELLESKTLSRTNISYKDQ